MTAEDFLEEYGFDRDIAFNPEHHNPSPNPIEPPLPSPQVAEVIDISDDEIEIVEDSGREESPVV